MPDRRQVLRALLLGAAGLAVPASCGLPSGGHPIVDGPGPAPGGSGGSLPKAPVPTDAVTPEQLVSLFFGAVAGRIRSQDDLNVADQRAQKFLTGRARLGWPAPGTAIPVVRLLSGPTTTIGNGVNLVTVTVQTRGNLGFEGAVTPPSSSSGPRTLQFSVLQTSESGRPGGYLIDEIVVKEGDPHIGMMLDSARLDDRNGFVPQLVYFWSTDHTPALISDLRYVAVAGTSPELQYTDIVDWVLKGPSPFLTDAVQGHLYDGMTVVGPNLTVPDKDGLLINLANPQQRSLNSEQVMAQLRWSLRPRYEGTVRLQISSQPVRAEQASATDFRGFNPADHERERDRDRRSQETVEYCVAGGVVRPVANPTSVPAVLTGDPGVNKDVVLAALSPDLGSAALVKTDKQAKQLWVVDGQRSGKPAATLVTVNGQPLAGQAWSRPAFLPTDSLRAMVAVDGRLFLVNVSNGQASQLPLTLPVSAFAVSTDGHRIGLISDGAVYVRSLLLATDPISLSGGQDRPIDVGLTNCTAVTWSELERVLVAGQRGSSYQLVEVTVDGAILSDWTPSFNTQILSLAALPPVAWAPSSSPKVALLQVETTNGASRVRQHSADSVQFSAPDGPSPPPSAGGAASPGLGVPTNPFYVG